MSTSMMNYKISTKLESTPLVIIGVPHHQGEVNISLLKSMMALDHSGYDLGFVESANPEVAINRNTIVQKFLDHPARATHLFFVDSDMGFRPDAVKKLLEANKPIVSGVAVQKYSNLWVAKNWGDLWEGFHTVQVDLCPRVPMTEPHWIVKDEFKDKVIPIGATGAACMMIKREVFENVPYPWFYNEYNPNATRQELMSYMSEDISFCYKAEKFGYQTHLHTGVLCDHYAGLRKFPPFWELP